MKSGRRAGDLSGLHTFCARYPAARPLLVGADGIPVEEFLITPPIAWVQCSGRGNPGTR